MSNDSTPSINDVPLTSEFVFQIAQSLESRIDYNFNSIMQVSLLVEFLYQTLEEQGIEIPLDEKFEEFQSKRVQEIQNKFEEVAKQMTEDLAKETVENSIDNANINLKDD